MKKLLTYIFIIVTLVGIFGLVSVKQARADQCVLTGWTYASCHNGTGALSGSIYTGTQATPAGSQETCTTGNTNMSQATCSSDGGQWFSSPNNPPSTQEGVSVTTSTQAGTTPAPTVGGACTGQDSSGNNTPPGCNATLTVPGSGCVITNLINPNTCTGWGGNFVGNSLVQLNSTCTVSGWSPTSCQQNGGVYTPPGVTPGTVNQQNLNSYTLLAPLPNPSGGQLTTLDVSSANSLGTYLNLIISIFIGICAVLAVIMILWGGIEYMTSELISSKEAGKERIRNALLGLLLALGAWTIINTINPNLLNTTFSSLQSVAANATLPLTQAQQIANFTGGGTCTPVTSSSSQCSVANLTSWGFVPSGSGNNGAQQASDICNGESGGNANQVSGVDVGSDGNGFSFGLFQVNALAHANDIVDPSNGSKPCQGVWQVNSNDPNAVPGYSSKNTATLGSCLQLDKTGTICIKYSAVVVNQSQYNTCENFLTNPTNNIAYAANLEDQNGWNAWGADRSCPF